MRYSVRERRWYGEKADRPPAIDPYSPTSPDYAKRSKVTLKKLPNGVVIVNTG